MNPLIAVTGFVGLVGVLAWLSRDKPPRAFISFAAEDVRMRDLFVGQAKHRKTPWNFEDASLHEPFSEKWKTQARERIRRCDVLIQLVSETTYRADGAIWEVNCAREEKVPVFGVWVSKDGSHKRPSCFAKDDVIPWTWEGVQARLERVLKERRAQR